MATAKKRIDKYSNKAVKKIIMSAANTLTFEQLDFRIAPLESRGMVIQQIVYHIDEAMDDLAAAADILVLGLTTTNQLTVMSPEDPAVLAYLNISPAGVNVEPLRSPIVQDFSNLAGGGLIVSPARLYLGMATAGFVGAGQAIVWLFYTDVSLSDREAIELLQTHLPSVV